MYRHIIHCVLILLLLTSFGCDSPPSIRPLPPQAVVLAFGDSLTHGTGAPSGQAYPDILARRLDRKVINAGVPGEVSAAGRERLPAALDRYRPDLLILCHGGNDFLHRLDRDTTSSNLQAMIEQAQSRGIDVVLIGVPQFGFVLEPPKFYAELAKQYHTPYEDEILSDLLSDRALKSDTIHPNAEGYRLLAEAVFELLEKAQKQ
jgi:lysophospholipase L1-like esterase